MHALACMLLLDVLIGNRAAVCQQRHVCKRCRQKSLAKLASIAAFHDFAEV